MQYPVVIHKQASSDYGVSVPDLPGCTAAGRSVSEALTMAREAILGHLETMTDEGMELPRPDDIEQHKADPDHADAYLWALVEDDPGNLTGRAIRVNVTIGERVLAVLDEFAAAEGESRSGLLQRAALRYISEQRHGRADDAPPPAKLNTKRRHSARPGDDVDAITYGRASLAAKIAKRRKAAGLSQTELSKLADVPRVTLSRIETGKTTPSTAAVEKLDRALAACEREQGKPSGGRGSKAGKASAGKPKRQTRSKSK